MRLGEDDSVTITQPNVACNACHTPNSVYHPDDLCQECQGLLRPIQHSLSWGQQPDALPRRHFPLSGGHQKINLTHSQDG